MSKPMQRKMILQSSFDAMLYHCPLFHGMKGEPCRKHGKPLSEIVCRERRALVTITNPGRMVRAPW